MERKPDGGKRIRVILMIAGIGLILTALFLEIMAYPWPWLFSATDQTEASLPDPTPVVLAKDDAGADIVWASAPPQASPADRDILPGEENRGASPVSKYVQLGVFKIPSIRVSAHLFEGTQRQLRYGVGHVAGTAGAGQAGNCAVAGHRGTFFRYLSQLDTGDSILIKADGKVYTYSVYTRFTVLPDSLWVLDDVDGEGSTLTLITCTPYLISSHRLIVRARLIDSSDAAQA